MSPTQHKDANEQVHRLLSQLRAEFDGIRERESPIRITLVHRATNADADGVKDHPSRHELAVAVMSAGNREYAVNYDADGNPKFIDPPLPDINGRPIANSVGQGLDVTMPASRYIELYGNRGAARRLRSLAVRGGQLAEAWPNETLRLLIGWQFITPQERWWALLFELAWSGRHRLLTAKRQLWLTDAKGSVVYLPYDVDELEAVGKLWKGIPNRWLKRLPNAFMSEIDDAASACSDLAGVLLDECRATESDGSPSQSAVEIWNQLTDRQRNCIQALYESQAFDADRSRQADEIAIGAEGSSAKVSGFKQPLSDLVARGLIESKVGRGGGSWLSATGRALFEAAQGGTTTDNAST